MSSLLPQFPHSRETERAVLGAVLLDDAVMEEMETDSSDLFYVQAHVKLFDAFRAIHLAGKPIDLLHIQAQLEDELDAIGGIAYLGQLDLDLPDLDQVPRYLEILRDLQGRRRLMALGLRVMAEAASRDAGDARALAESMATEAGLVAASRTRGGLISLGEVLEATAARIEAGATAFECIPTGFYDLDGKLGGGMTVGNLIVIAGRPGMGKSALAMDIAKNVGISGFPAGYFSLEMMKEELGLRVMAEELGISFGLLKAGQIEESHRMRPAAVAAELLSYPISINDRGGQTAGSIIAESKKAKLKVIVVDYLQLLVPDGRSENRNLEIGAMTRRFKEAAKNLNAVVVLLSQLSREPEKRSDKRPQLSDLRESGATEQDSDAVILLYREDYYDRFAERPGVCEANVAKNRNGATGVVDLGFDSCHTRFYNLETRREPPLH